MFLDCTNSKVPSSDLLNVGGKVTILETISECPRTSGSGSVSDMSLVPPHAVSEEMDPDSPESESSCNETMGLLQSTEDQSSSSKPSPRAKNQTAK